MAITAAVASIAVGAVGTAAQLDAQKDAQKAAEQEQQRQENINTAAAQDSRRSAIREERVKRAQVEQAAQNSGTAGSSAAIGAAGQLNQNVALQGSQQAEQTANAQASSAYAQSQADIQSGANRAQAITGLAQSVIKIPGMFDTGE